MSHPKTSVLLALTFVVGLSACVARTYNGERIRVCPIHDEKMEIVKVESIYGLVRPPSEDYFQAEQRDFPYAERPALKGCIVMPWSWLDRHDRIRACSSCTEAREQYLADHPDLNR